jgi:hypothetical protein
MMLSVSTHELLSQSKLNQQKEDIQELQALCEYLENKLLLGNDDDGS